MIFIFVCVSDWKETCVVKCLAQNCTTRWPNSQPSVYESCAALLHHMCIMIQTYFEILKEVIKVLTPVLWCCLFVHFQWSNFTSCDDLIHTNTQFDLILLTTYSHLAILSTQVSSAENVSNFFFSKYHCHFWIQFIRCIQMSANKPRIGPVALEVTFEIF